MGTLSKKMRNLEAHVEEDLEIYIDGFLKLKFHCQKVADKAMPSHRLLRNVFDTIFC